MPARLLLSVIAPRALTSSAAQRMTTHAQQDEAR